MSLSSCWLDSLPFRAGAAAASHCPDAGAPRVAFLVAGVARGFDRERMRRAFHEFVVSPLAPSPAQRDIYVALKIVNTTSSLYDQPKRELRTDKAALERGLQALKPRAVHLSFASTDEGAVLQPPSGVAAEQRCFHRLRDGVRGFVSTMRRALLQMRANEPVGQSYDLVVFMRPDLLHLRPLASWCDPRWTGVRAGAELLATKNDHMLVLHRSTAGLLLEAIEAAMTSMQVVGPRHAPSCPFLGAADDPRDYFRATEPLGRLLVRATRRRSYRSSSAALPVPCLRDTLPDQKAGLVRGFLRADRSCPEQSAGVRFATLLPWDPPPRRSRDNDGSHDSKASNVNRCAGKPCENDQGIKCRPAAAPGPSASKGSPPTRTGRRPCTR